MNKIFYLLNNKVSIYDREYLKSLYRLWLKKYNETLNIKNKGKLSGLTSKKKLKHFKSNSYQNIDDNSSDNEIENSIHSI